MISCNMQRLTKVIYMSLLKIKYFYTFDIRIIENAYLEIMYNFGNNRNIKMGFNNFNFRESDISNELNMMVN